MAQSTSTAALQRQSRERTATTPHAAPHRPSVLPLHTDPGPAKMNGQRALCPLSGKHTHALEFPSYLPEKPKEVLSSTEHDPKVQIHDKRSPRVKTGLYFSAGIAPKNIPAPAFQITTDKAVTKMQNWFRKYLIISF